MVKMNALNIIVIFIIHLTLTQADELPCNVTQSVDISDGERNSDDKSITKDGITYREEQYFENEGKTMGCICNVKACIKKCCPIGKYMTSEKQCVETEKKITEDILPLIGSRDINTYAIIDVPCNKRGVLINPEVDNEQVVIQANGSLLLGEEGDDEEIDDYCVDYIGSTDYVQIVLCNLGGAEEESNSQNSIGIYLDYKLF